MALRYSSVLVAVLALWPAAARADDATDTGDVVITTTDGAMFRGRVIERIPGKYVAVQLPSGETRRISLGAIAKETVVQPQSPGVATAGPAPAAALAPTRTVHVDFMTDVDRAELQQIDTDDTWSVACRGSCSTNVSGAGLYRIGGTGIERSTAFRFPAERTNVHVDASVATTTTTGWGIILVGGGAGLAVFIGLPLLALGAVVDSSPDHELHGSATGITTTGTVITVGGLLAAIGGIMMIVNNGTSVTVARKSSPTRFVAGGGAPPLLGWTF